MFAAGEQAEHSGGVLLIYRFPKYEFSVDGRDARRSPVRYQDLAVAKGRHACCRNYYNGVGAENIFVVCSGPNCTRFFSRHSFCENLWSLSGMTHFGNVCGSDHEFNAGISQKLLAAWGS